MYIYVYIPLQFKGLKSSPIAVGIRTIHSENNLENYNLDVPWILAWYEGWQQFDIEYKRTDRGFKSTALPASRYNEP
jgi:hypothetical protein